MDNLRSHTSLLASDGKGTPLAVHGREAQRIAWSAHGFQGRSTGVMRTGFNGELREHRGVYLLGSYRAYNPVLMCLHSPDSLSPFGPGGVNAYAYCLGDPVNRVDPTGHLPWWGTLAVGLAAPALGLTLSIASKSVATALALSTRVTVGLSIAALAVETVALFTPKGKVQDTLAGVGLGLGAMAAVGLGVVVKNRFGGRSFRSLFRARRRSSISLPEIGLPPPPRPRPPPRPPLPAGNRMPARLMGRLSDSRLGSSRQQLNLRIKDATSRRDLSQSALERAVADGASEQNITQLRAASALDEQALVRAERALGEAAGPRPGMPAPINPPDLIRETLRIRDPLPL